MYTHIKKLIVSDMSHGPHLRRLEGYYIFVVLPVRVTILGHKLRTATADAIYHPAEESAPDVSAGAHFERRLRLMCDIACFLSRSFFVVAAVISKHIVRKITETTRSLT